jgi:hypothetical protein
LKLIKKLAALCLPNKNSPHCAFQTPDITTPIRTIPTRIKKTPQNPVNQQHSNQQVEQSEQENIFTAFYQSTLESFLGKFSRFFLRCNFLRILEQLLVSFD